MKLLVKLTLNLFMTLLYSLKDLILLLVKEESSFLEAKNRE